MKVIHMRVRDITSSAIAKSIETTLLRLAGVMRVAVISSPGLISVLFDETTQSVRGIVRAITTLGLDVTVVPRASYA